jgi:hypothetical protein
MSNNPVCWFISSDDVVVIVVSVVESIDEEPDLRSLEDERESRLVDCARLIMGEGLGKGVEEEEEEEADDEDADGADDDIGDDDESVLEVNELLLPTFPFLNELENCDDRSSDRAVKDVSPTPVVVPSKGRRCCGPG